MLSILVLNTRSQWYSLLPSLCELRFVWNAISSFARVVYTTIEYLGKISSEVILRSLSPAINI